MPEDETPTNSNPDEGKPKAGKSDNPPKGGKPEGEPKPKADSDATSFDRIVAGLQEQVKSLQTTIAQKDMNADDLRERLSSMENVLKQMQTMKQPPKMEEGETLVDAVCRILGIDHLF